MRNMFIKKKFKKSNNFLLLTSHFSLQQGFSLIEVCVVLGIFFILIGLVTLNFFKIQNKTQLSGYVNSFLADMKEQQIKAMAGDTDGSASASAYGVHFETTSYTLFRNAYGTNNFVVSLPSNVHIAGSTNPVLFASGSGELNPTTNSLTITFTDTADGSQKVVTLNRYGVVTSIN